MRLQRTLGLSILYATTSQISAQYDQVDADTWKQIKSFRAAEAAAISTPAQASKDAYDDRMDRYDAIAKFEESYWKARGQAWEDWAVDQVGSYYIRIA